MREMKDSGIEWITEFVGTHQYSSSEGNIIS